MTKQEFETLINKEVTYETFRLYESMYNALPESINKQQFIKMLNLKSIPENPEAIRRREENQKIVKEINNRLKNFKKSMKKKILKQKDFFILHIVKNVDKKLEVKLESLRLF